MSYSKSKSLGKYQILEQLGKGGFATVFRARDPDLDRDVALKVMDPLLMRDPVWVQRFRQEAKAIARLKHPRIITIHEIGQSEGVLYIATELVEGGSLADRIAKEGRLSWEDTVQLVGEIADALGYAHSQGVLHRDMKPANVLLDPSTGAILTDFGFARIVADHSLSVSMSGGVVGTPAYIAPEVWHGDKATAQTDVYALGCILYEMVTGKDLFIGATPPAVMLAHFQPPPLPDTWPEDVPPGLTEVLDKTLAREPDQRYRSAGELADALAALNIDRLAEPYADLEQAIADEDWKGALILADEIKAADADYRDVAALEQQAQAGLEEAAKRQRIADLREKAEQALAAGDWQSALAVVDELKAADPKNEDVAVLEQKALAGMEEDARKQQGVQWQEAVETALVAGNLEAAELALAQWDGLGIDDQRVQAYRKRIQDERTAVAQQQQEKREKEKQQKATQASRSAAKPERQPVKKEKVATKTQQPPAVKRQPPTKKLPKSEFSSQKSSSAYWWIFIIPFIFVACILSIWVVNEGSLKPTPEVFVVEREVKVQVTVVETVEVTATPLSPNVTPDSSLGIGSTIISDKDGMELVYVPAGEFIMGSPDDEGRDNEYPQHTVFLDAFWIDKTEVTNAQYQKCLAAGNCEQSHYADDSRFNQSNQPVVGVSWRDASAYCQWAGRRLPTEAEWEKAARGPSTGSGQDTDGRIYPWGNDFDGSKLNSSGSNDGYDRTAPVGNYPSGASPFGALDMAGNVWEWVADWYDSDYYDQSPDRNPPGPESGDYRVLRGGSWDNYQNLVRSASRYYRTPDGRNDLIGFRCAAPS